MKVCILSGSENPNGNTAIMCDNAAAYLKDMKIKYDLFNLYEEEVDFVAEEIKKYDVVIIATPIHSFYCSDAVKELMDFAFENEDYFDGRRKESGIKIKSAIMVSHGYDEGYAVTQTETFKNWEKELEEKHGIKILSFSFYDGPRHFMTNKPINTPDDLKGQRIRTIGQEVCTESLAAMGATPISMSWGEVYNGIQSKALDGCEAQNTSTFPSKIYEVCNTQSKTGHFQLMQGLICGKKWFDSLPEDLQTLLTETAQEIGKETAADVMKEADEAEQQMKDAGLTVIEPDVQPFKDAVEPVYEKLGFAELRQQIYKEIGKTE